MFTQRTIVRSGSKRRAGTGHRQCGTADRARPAASRLRPLARPRPCGDPLLLRRAATTHAVGGGGADRPLPRRRPALTPDPAALGYVGSEQRQFYLTPRVLTLGYAYLSSLSFADVAQAHLTDLANEVHESCSASVLDGLDIVYIARTATKRIMTISLSIAIGCPLM